MAFLVVRENFERLISDETFQEELSCFRFGRTRTCLFVVLFVVYFVVVLFLVCFVCLCCLYVFVSAFVLLNFSVSSESYVVVETHREGLVPILIRYWYDTEFTTGSMYWCI